MASRRQRQEKASNGLQVLAGQVMNGRQMGTQSPITTNTCSVGGGAWKSKEEQGRWVEPGWTYFAGWVTIGDYLQEKPGPYRSVVHQSAQCGNAIGAALLLDYSDFHGGRKCEILQTFLSISAHLPPPL